MLLLGPEKKLLPIPGYSFATEIAGYLKGLFVENVSFEKRWNKNPLWFEFEKEGKENFGNYLTSKSIEYYLIQRLSLHLSSFYGQNKFQGDKLITFERKDIPSIILENEFLELFSKPMNQRPMFSDEIEEDEEGTVWFGLPNGLTFDKFELTLPVSSKIKKRSPYELRIITPKMIIDFDTKFKISGGKIKGVNRDFYQYYMNINSFEDYWEFTVKIKVSFKFNFISIFSNRRNDYYNWVDSFIKELNSNISKEEYFNKINWQFLNNIRRILK